MEISKAVELLTPLGQSSTTWTQSWRWATIPASAVVVLASIIHFALNWDYEPAGNQPEPTPSFPSFTMPSFPDITTMPSP
jgi:hypothetical protein